MLCSHSHGESIDSLLPSGQAVGRGAPPLLQSVGRAGRGERLRGRFADGRPGELNPPSLFTSLSTSLSTSLLPPCLPHYLRPSSLPPPPPLSPSLLLYLSTWATRRRTARRVEPWPLHDIAIANSAWCMTFKGGVGGGTCIGQWSCNCVAIGYALQVGGGNKGMIDTHDKALS